MGSTDGGGGIECQGDHSSEAGARIRETNEDYLALKRGINVKLPSPEPRGDVQLPVWGLIASGQGREVHHRPSASVTAFAFVVGGTGNAFINDQKCVLNPALLFIWTPPSS